MNLNTTETIFWVSLCILFYTWIGYPSLLFIIERILYRPIKKSAITPTVSIVVTAYDEEAVIARKIENLLALDYPKHLLEIVVADDGSMDRTPEIVSRYNSKGVKLHSFRTRRGKPSVLNDVIPKLTGEIVILTDARQRLDKDIIHKLSANFADPEVGGVSGELVFEKPEAAGMAVSIDAYWKYEKFIRAKEAGIHSTAGGTGAIYALRRELFSPLPVDAILDDVVLPLNIIKRGYRNVMEIGARAWDTANSDWHREFARKTRTLSGNFQVLFNFIKMGPGFLSPVLLQYLSHKILRLLGPLCLVAMFATNHIITKSLPESNPLHGFYSCIMGGQIAFYVLAFFGIFLKGSILRIPLVSLPYSFVILQGAIVIGFLRFGSGRDDALWDKPQSSDTTESYRRGKRLLIDSALFVIAFWLAFTIRYWGTPDPSVLQSYTDLNPDLPHSILGLKMKLPIVVLIPIFTLYFFRANEISSADMSPYNLLTILKGVFYSTLILFLAIYVKRDSMLIEAPGAENQIVSFPTSVIFIGFILSCFMIGGWRLISKSVLHSDTRDDDSRTDLMLIGTGSLSDDKIRGIEQVYTPPARIIDGQSHNEIAPDEQLKQLLSIVSPEGIVVDTNSMTTESILTTLSIADDRSLPVEMLPGDFEIVTGKCQPRLASYIPLIEIGKTNASETYLAIKRTVDILLGGVGILLSPAFLLLRLYSWLIYPKRKSITIGRTKRAVNHNKTIYLPRLRHTADWPKWWVAASKLSIHSLELISGRLTIIGPPQLSPKKYDRLNRMARAFYQTPPGIYSLNKIKIHNDKNGLDPVSSAIVYYARNRSFALDLQIVMNHIWNRR